MKLYEVPRNTWVKVLKAEDPPPDGMSVEAGECILMYNIDGMYSYCRNKNGQVVHLKAWTEVELVEAA